MPTCRRDGAPLRWPWRLCAAWVVMPWRSGRHRVWWRGLMLSPSQLHYLQSSYANIKAIAAYTFSKEVTLAGGRIWTEDEDQLLRSKYPIVGAAGLAAELERGLSAIRARASLIGVHYQPPPRLVEEDSAPWATSTIADRLDNKAACVIALYLRRGRLKDVDRKDIAAALGVSYWTLERYMATVDRIPDYLAAMDELLAALPKRKA